MKPTQKSERRFKTADVFVALVSKNEVSFTVHEGAITSKPSLFRAACESASKEKLEKVIRWPEVNLDHFENICIGSTPVVSVIKAPCLEGLLTKIARDCLYDLKLRNAAIDCIIESFKGCKASPRQAMIEFGYNETPSSSNLRLLICDYLIHRKSTSALVRKVGEALPKDFLIDLAIAALEDCRITTVKPSLQQDPCFYHEHNDAHPRCDSTAAEAEQTY
ncbi:hypothetical protein K431DRAFT_294607 [Polychaeton citri CBS 116435]|uniref:BTB domain-containing protein n=1 Tax=Polychaeton citri CBS 116435 TaxID=1314669 RepID=A0A9P4UMD9_9PEZI|nr:hypothetical protein K431DRAFT_294607 [Polychaeton citri CBS 116435]